MKASIRQKLDLLVDRLDEIDRMLSAPGVANDMDQFRKLSRERAEIEPVWSSSTPSVRLLLPKDPNDERNVILEIRAGTGGDESALFAGDLFRMYTRYAERQRWQVEVMSASESDLGGYKESSPHGRQRRLLALKFESGGHRVQRVPETETQGRIHTSACTVAVMPEADEVERCQTSTRPTCASTPSAPRAPAASTSTRPTRRCASPTCRPASSSNARTAARSTKNKAQAMRCWPRASTTPITGTSAAAWSAERPPHAQEPDRQRRPLRAHPHLQLPAGAASPTTAST
jgi:hypothetical protein